MEAKGKRNNESYNISINCYGIGRVFTLLPNGKIPHFFCHVSEYEHEPHLAKYTLQLRENVQRVFRSLIQ
jgi:hypothetical protein